MREFEYDFRGEAKPYTRTQRPARYVLIDFGLSIHYSDSDMPRLAFPVRGNDRSVPEFQDESLLVQPYNPFPTDVYYVGNAIKMYFTDKGKHPWIKGYLDLEYLDSLLADMTQADPSKRPTIDEAVARMEEIIKSRSRCHLRAAVKHPDATTLEKVPWFMSKGYGLRKRYQPDWIASWKINPQLFWLAQEDFAHYVIDNIMDGVHTATGERVVFKKVKKEGNEVEMVRLLTSPPLVEESQKYIIRIIEIIHDIPDDEDHSLVVMPLLQKLNHPEFETVGECVDCALQMLKAVQLLHRHNIAHRNMVMDAPGMYPNGFHPIYRELDYEHRDFAVPYTRTECPARYLLIDFGLSIHFPDDVTERLAIPARGNDHSVPEFQDKAMMDKPYDPFPIIMLVMRSGNILQIQSADTRKVIAPGKVGMNFFLPLVEDMTNPDPLKRPSIHEAVDRMESIINSLGTCQLRKFHDERHTSSPIAKHSTSASILEHSSAHLNPGADIIMNLTHKVRGSGAKNSFRMSDTGQTESHGSKKWDISCVPRYQPGWIASWVLNPQMTFLSGQEDYTHYITGKLMDAIHMESGEHVMFKKVEKDSKEVNIILFLNSPSMIE
ncbi:hypothetical protein CVT24_009456, partial [Panaeolus cyanescens]